MQDEGSISVHIYELLYSWMHVHKSLSYLYNMFPPCNSENMRKYRSNEFIFDCLSTSTESYSTGCESDRSKYVPFLPMSFL